MLHIKINQLQFSVCLYPHPAPKARVQKHGLGGGLRHMFKVAETHQTRASLVILGTGSDCASLPLKPLIIFFFSQVSVGFVQGGGNLPRERSGFIQKKQPFTPRKPVTPGGWALTKCFYGSTMPEPLSVHPPSGLGGSGDPPLDPKIYSPLAH